MKMNKETRFSSIEGRSDEENQNKMIVEGYAIEIGRASCRERV